MISRAAWEIRTFLAFIIGAGDKAQPAPRRQIETNKPARLTWQDSENEISLL